MNNFSSISFFHHGTDRHRDVYGDAAHTRKLDQPIRRHNGQFPNIYLAGKNPEEHHAAECYDERGRLIIRLDPLNAKVIPPWQFLKSCFRFW